MTLPTHQTLWGAVLAGFKAFFRDLLGQVLPQRLMVTLWACLALLSGTGQPAQAAELATATFAGGCFWCMEAPFDQLPGVVSTVAGYTGGDQPQPTYEQVSSGTTGHREAMQVTYDPAQVDYAQLLDVFWHNVDPLDARGQFCDKGSQYRAAVFYGSAAERDQAEASKQAIAAQLGVEEATGIAAEILPAQAFYPAEDYHQDYYLTHPVRYKIYRFGCGRDQRLAQLWDHSGHP